MSPAVSTASSLMATLGSEESYYDKPDQVRQDIGSEQAVRELMHALGRGVIPLEVERAAALVAQLLPDLGDLEPSCAAELHAWGLWALVGLFASSRENRLTAASLVLKGVPYCQLRDLERISGAGQLIVARLIALFLLEPQPSPYVDALAACLVVDESRLRRILGFGLRDGLIPHLRTRGYEPPYFELPQDVSVAGYAGFVASAKALILSFRLPDEFDTKSEVPTSKYAHWDQPLGSDESSSSPYKNWTERSGPKGIVGGETNWRDAE